MQHELRTNRDYKSIFQQQGKKVVGFKLQEYQGYDTELRQYIQQENFKAITLTRNDKLELLVSLEVAKKFDYWHTRGMPFPATKINITQKQYRDFLNWHNLTLDKINRELQGLQVLPLTYEDLTQDWQGSINQVCQFLEVDPMPLQPDTKKGREETLGSWIDNEEELRKVEYEQGQMDKHS